MTARFGLRIRILLFFILLAGGGLAAVLSALWIGYGRSQATSVGDGFMIAAIIASFALLGLNVGVWLLFDENVAKPIERIAARMRAGAHTDGALEVGTDAAKYLGDLAPAADAVCRRLGDRALSVAEQVAAETQRLSAEKAQLTALLTEIPVAMMMVSDRDQIVLYDGQSAEVLSQIQVPRLYASVFDYFQPGALEEAKSRLDERQKHVELELKSVNGDLTMPARIRALAGGGYLLTIDDVKTQLAPEASRPLVYDFTLLTQEPSKSLQDTPLRSLVFSVFDTETTGLLPHKDAIVQIGAVRVVGGRMVPGEEFDMLVDPGRPIPPASTKVHRIDDHMVKGRLRAPEAARSFHEFCKGGVLVAHNAPFDLAFIKRETADTGLDWSFPVLDTVLLSAVVFGESETHTLDALAERLGIAIDDAHRHSALGDARATAEVLVKLIPILEGRGLDTFGKVVTQTRAHGRLLQDMN